MTTGRINQVTAIGTGQAGAVAVHRQTTDCFAPACPQRSRRAVAARRQSRGHAIESEGEPRGAHTQRACVRAASVPKSAGEAPPHRCRQPRGLSTRPVRATPDRPCSFLQCSSRPAGAVREAISRGPISDTRLPPRGSEHEGASCERRSAGLSALRSC